MFLANNFEEGDEIFLFGYSRGAFAARAVAGLISRIGLLKKTSLDEFQGLYNFLQRSGGDSVMCDRYLEEKGSKLSRHGDVKIKVVGCWDTVSSLFWGSKFYDTKLTPSRYGLLGGWVDTEPLSSLAGIEHAFQCLALDERRGSFKPELWHLPLSGPGEDVRPLDSTTLRQIWMLGVHADVGGHKRSANTALAWMIDQCSGLLAFDDDYILTAFNSFDLRPTDKTVFDTVVDKCIRYLPMDRTPGEYEFGEPGKSGSWAKTNEMVHPSVWEEMIAYPDWKPLALKGFQRVPVDGASNSFKWVKVVPWGESARTVELPEYEIARGSWGWIVQGKP